MKKIKLNSYSILYAVRKTQPEEIGPVVIAAGKLSDVVKHAIKVSAGHYHNFSVKYGGGELNELDIHQVYKRNDFPK